MGNIKPLGSEKLKNMDEKLKRILELTYFGDSKKSNPSTNKAELVRESSVGVYGIVKERDGYYVKQGLNESSLEYIGGLFMKNKNRFSSYAEALKRMELISGQDNLQEATKYVLKQKSSESPMGDSVAPQPTNDAPEELPAPGEEESLPPTEGGDLPPVDSMDDMGGETSDDVAGKRSDYMGEIQKYAGKLGQQLRDEKEKLESDDIKYVLNMVISAVDLNKLELEDLEDIGKKFDREEDEDGVPSPEDDMGGDDMGGDDMGGEPNPEEEEMGEVMDKLSQFIKSTAPSDKKEIDLSKYSMKETEEMDEEKELDLDQMRNDINKSIGATLSKYFK